MRVTSTRARVVPAVAGVVALSLVSVGVGALLTGAVRLPAPLDLRPELVVGGLVFITSAPLLLARWRTTFWILLAWFMVEDLIRKSLGNDIRVYFMKDVLYVVLVIGLAMDPGVRGMWKRATGEARFPLYAMVLWSITLAVPMLFVDWRIPVIGFKLDFSYLFLVTAGFVMASRETGPRDLLTGFVLLAIPVCAVGIVQGTVGPGFLRPSVATPGLRLELVRAGDVFQPTGPFADAGRFGSMALVSLVASLSLLLLTFRRARDHARLVAGAGVAVSAAAIWIHAGKAGIIVAVFLGAVAAVAPSFAERRPATIRALAVVGLMAFVLLGMFTLLPDESGSRTKYFQSTLDPRVATNEWESRGGTWLDNTARGISTGGLIGQGTGANSLGLQYISEGGDVEGHTGVQPVEGGYAAVALEWGVVGLLLWLAWTVAWSRGLWGSIMWVRGRPEAAAGLVIFAYVVISLFVAFWLGFQGFQNYYGNAYFWILSGVVFALPWSTGTALRERSRVAAAT